MWGTDCLAAICLQQLLDFWAGISVTGRKERKWKEANKNAKEHQSNVFPAICFGVSASSLLIDLWEYPTRGSPCQVLGIPKALGN